MNFFHHKKFVCEEDNQKFETYEELIDHSRHIHHITILKCNGCGKEFIHEKDRLHHVREEHGKELDRREHKDEYKKVVKNPEQDMDEHSRKFSDNL
jgi:uncharacterized C2H2 Zn-finger protein